ncbi:MULTISPECIES: response regulator [unclassified Bradyrhizobium]|uniref:response regulator n=1 Tax=unclassified Bradyrhizobium TaxID=2631580 RepID=UPI0028EB4A83|nr:MULTISPECIES: response regulator [unclassified Bradyrhizobium]
MSDANAVVEILLVEDNATDAELCIRALKKHNLANRLVWVKDGAEALDFLFARGAFADRAASAGHAASIQPKVVLLDLRLPKVDGLEVIRKVRADAVLKVLPIVVLTSSKEDRDVVEAYKLGANAFVSKPVEFDEFATKVAQLGLFWLLVNKPPL